MPTGSDVSPNPDVMQIAAFTPWAAHSLIAATAESPGTAITASSGTSGSLSIEANAGTPCTSGRPGLMAKILPLKPNFWR